MIRKLLRSAFPVTFALAFATTTLVAQEPFALPHRALLEREAWWDNRDWEWYERNIPFFDCPDRDIVTTYYYRWELVTKHAVEGSAEHGFAFTEFMDRPFWSGAYGAISCPAGHQLYELRWLRSTGNRWAEDYAKYWHVVPGAQPRRYSTWLADATWAVHAVQENPELIRAVYAGLVENFQAWEKRHWVPERGLFWQNGHDDGMEFNINSRQTQDILRGGDAFRPTLNVYLWADAVALSRMAEMLGKSAAAVEWKKKADALREAMQKALWCPKREFFLPRAMKEETSKSGHKVAPWSLTYETGEHAGSPHGRELIGYVPWQFSLPEAGKGYEVAWKFLMDSDYFAAPYGPTSVERKDPMFHLAPGCCWWSGRSWPYATAQTLTALARLLQDYQQSVVQPADYVELLRVYAQTHRKNGKPYLAEAADPFTGSWEGHDAYFHSEHYFHSSYCDLVLSGLMGIDLREPGKLTLHPLFPSTWEFAAVDNLLVRNREIAVVWDKTGQKYQKGTGLQIFADGRKIHSQADLKPVRLDLAPRAPEAKQGVPEMNLAVNNAGDRFPEILASTEAEKTSVGKLMDGQYWYSEHPPNRWASERGDAAWLELDFGTSRECHAVELYLIEDEPQGPVALPASVQCFQWLGEKWVAVPLLAADQKPKPDAANLFRFAEPVQARRLRFTLAPQGNRALGVSELRALGPNTVENRSPVPAEAAGKNLALTAKATASHTSKWDAPSEAHDGKLQYLPEPRNRWTCYESPNAQDWLELAWEQPQDLTRLDVFLFDDRGGVQAPEKLEIQHWNAGSQTWEPIPSLRAQPTKPAGSRRNGFTFPKLTTTRLRLLFTHRQGSKSGVTEIEAF